MLSIESLKNDVDLVSLVSRDTTLRRVASTGGGEMAGPCPFCGGTDRFRIQPQHKLGGPRWFCRSCSPRWNSAIDYIMRRDNIALPEAIKTLEGKTTLSANFNPAPVAPPVVAHAGPPSAAWQQAAEKFIAWASEQLFSAAGTRGRDYLHARGLTDDTLRTWKIGYNPKEWRVPPAKWGLDGAQVYIAPGVVIPCRIAGQIWGVKMRNLDYKGEGNKYPQIRGSRPALFGADTIAGHDVVLVTEGEFDAMLAWQICTNAEYPAGHKRDMVGVATLGSAVADVDMMLWGKHFLNVKRFMVCYDTDAAGQKGAAKWNDITALASRVTVPEIKQSDKDLTDFHLSGGRILDLITNAIASARGNVPMTACDPADYLPDLERAYAAIKDDIDSDALHIQFAELLHSYERACDQRGSGMPVA